MNSGSENNFGNVCNLTYLNETMGGNKELIREILDIFLKQTPQDLQDVNDAVGNGDYLKIKAYSHKMKSSVSIVGISTAVTILQQMEDLGAKGEGIENIKELNERLNLICKQAINEIEREKLISYNR